MADKAIDLEEVRGRAVELLRREDRYMTTGELSVELGVPFWGTDHALERAYLACEVVFSAGVGWKAAPAEPTKRGGDQDAMQEEIL